MVAARRVILRDRWRRRRAAKSRARRAVETIGRIGAYGLRALFMITWLVRSAAPARGQVVVFADPADSMRILVERVVAVAGDRLQWDERGLSSTHLPTS